MEIMVRRHLYHKYPKQLTKQEREKAEEQKEMDNLEQYFQKEYGLEEDEWKSVKNIVNFLFMYVTLCYQTTINHTLFFNIIQHIKPINFKKKTQNQEEDNQMIL